MFQNILTIKVLDHQDLRKKKPRKYSAIYKKALRQGSSLLSGWLVIARFLHKKYFTYLLQEAPDSHFSAPNPLQLSLS